MSIVASGECLYVGRVGVPNTFILTVGPEVRRSLIRVAIRGPRAPTITMRPKGERLIEVSYVLNTVGRYTIQVTHRGDNIPGSPFSLIVRDHVRFQESPTSSPTK